MAFDIDQQQPSAGASCPHLDRRDMRVRRVAVDGLHGGEVLVAHVQHFGTFPRSQMCRAVLQGGRLLILVPVLLRKQGQK